MREDAKGNGEQSRNSEEGRPNVCELNAFEESSVILRSFGALLA